MEHEVTEKAAININY